MFCTNCGKQIDDGAMFCPECGTRIIQGQEQVHSAEPMYRQQVTSNENLNIMANIG